MHPVSTADYQDISKGWYTLIKAMRDQKDFDLFCVGDDLQSIYRFAGSNIGFILNFNGYTEANLADFLAARLTELPENYSVFFIGRYSAYASEMKREVFSCPRWGASLRGI